MAKRKRGHDKGHEDSHRWVISYADFITLLFAFFVVMYAISSVNISKYRSLAEGMSSAFNKHDRKRPSNIIRERSEVAVETKINEDDFNRLEMALQQLKGEEFKISRHEGWVELDIKAASLFDSGSAQLVPDAEKKLIQVAKLIDKLPYPVALEGYTDNKPIYTTQFPSNWELSSSRASAVARILTQNGVSAERVTVTGYAAQYPIATNRTEAGRAKNRRVNIIIAKDKTVPRLLNPEMRSEFSKSNILLESFITKIPKGEF
ncbi:OmpA family protein [Legionella sp. W05-934-2]|uniref:OmpA family protein n=1 Tax=Legionella sp. W05-934-2 TaxID=1198649 RepID=UPI0034626599